MKDFAKHYLVPIAIAASPLAVFAATAVGTDTGLLGILGKFSGLLNALVTFLILLATVVFLWGIVKYIMAGGDEEKIKEARSTIIYGIIFLAVMLAVWGFVNIVLDFIFGTDQGRVGVPPGPQQ